MLHFNQAVPVSIGRVELRTRDVANGLGFSMSSADMASAKDTQEGMISSFGSFPRSKVGEDNQKYAMRRRLLLCNHLTTASLILKLWPIQVTIRDSLPGYHSHLSATFAEHTPSKFYI